MKDLRLQISKLNLNATAISDCEKINRCLKFIENFPVMYLDAHIRNALFLVLFKFELSGILSDLESKNSSDFKGTISNLYLGKTT